MSELRIPTGSYKTVSKNRFRYRKGLQKEQKSVEEDIFVIRDTQLSVNRRYY